MAFSTAVPVEMRLKWLVHGTKWLVHGTKRLVHGTKWLVHGTVRVEKLVGETAVSNNQQLTVNC